MPRRRGSSTSATPTAPVPLHRCPGCGDALAPHRVVIDRDRLDDEAGLAWLRRGVEAIAERRSMQADRRLRLRATDVRELAALVETTPVTLVRSLASRQVAEPV